MEGTGGGSTAVAKKGVLENFMLNHQNSLKSLFQRKKKSQSPSHSPFNDEDSPTISPKHIPQLSAIANSVIARCSKYPLFIFFNSRFRVRNSVVYYEIKNLGGVD